MKRLFLFFAVEKRKKERWRKAQMISHSGPCRPPMTDVHEFLLCKFAAEEDFFSFLFGEDYEQPPPWFLHENFLLPHSSCV